MSITSDPKHPGINKPKGEGEQNEAYLVLSEGERKKGFTRPLYSSYTHVGRKFEEVVLKDEPEEFEGKIYVAVASILKNEDGTPKGGRLLTQKEYDEWKKTGNIGGCGVSTVINSREIIETYARDPKFYGATWCMGCKRHIQNSEFIWDKSNELRVGS